MLIAACGGGGGGGGSTPPPATYTIGGSVSGLTGSGLVLQNNGGDNLTVAAKATSFTFNTALAGGAAYSVKVLTQPTNPAQTCTVSAGSGNVAAANVTSVAIACTNNTFSVGGSISGLTSGGLVLQDNGGDNLTLDANATTFTFKTGLLPGAAYSVSVLTQPAGPAQKCKVSAGTGSVVGSNITNVSIACRGVGQFVYVVNSTDGATSAGDVSGFTINSTDGTLTAMAGAPVAADLHPLAIAVDASGDFVYVSNSKSPDVSVYKSDPSTGALTLQNQATSTGTYGTAIAVSPSNQYVFVGGYGIPDTNTYLFGFSLDQITGSLTADPNSPYPASNTPQGLAVDPTSQFLFATASLKHALHAYTIGTPATTLLTEVASSPVNTDSTPYGVITSPLGNANGGFVFVTESGVGRVGVFSYDNMGNLTELTKYGSPWPSGMQSEGIAIDPTGVYLYVANYADGTVSSFSINTNGSLTAIQTENQAVSTGNLSMIPNPGPMDVKVDPTGRFVYVVNYLDESISLFTSASGMLTLVATYPTGSGPVALAID
jgi:6-phosphogluconolactonase (cycloisomerase 2 family)